MSVGKVAAQVGHAVHHAVTHSRPEMIEDDLDKIQNLRCVMLMLLVICCDFRVNVHVPFST